MVYSINHNTDSSYLIHYNKNHSKANGQFTSGDGDGDGIANDHAHQRKSKAQRLSDTIKETKAKKKKAAWIGLAGSIGGAAGAAIADVGMENDNAAMTAAGLVAGVAGLAVSTVAAIKIGKANSELKRQTSQLIDEHYGMPISEALDELQRN